LQAARRRPALHPQWPFPLGHIMQPARDREKSSSNVVIVFFHIFRLQKFFKNFLYILETQLLVKVYIGWSHQSCVVSKIQSKWRMASEFMWVALLNFRFCNIFLIRTVFCIQFFKLITQKFKKAKNFLKFAVLCLIYNLGI